MTTKLDELKITLGAAIDACDAAIEGDYADMDVLAARNAAYATASADYYAELKKIQEEDYND